MLPDANILQPLIDVANAVLKFFHNNVGLSWGMSIVAITVCTRAILVPLTYKQIKGMRAMQALQPQIKELQEKYKNDKQRMQQEMMRFYKENKVNPFASCVPLLAQLPVFITLFYTLRHELPNDICENLGLASGCETAGHASFLFVNDLTAKATGTELIALLVLYVGHPADLGLLHVGDRGQIAADDDVHPAADLRPLRDQLPLGPDRLLDHHEPLDHRAGDHGQQTDPGAGGAYGGGETGG